MTPERVLISIHFDVREERPTLTDTGGMPMSHIRRFHSMRLQGLKALQQRG
jgi:hypothetical protein